MAKDSVFINGIVTPQGRVTFPHLAKPDTGGQYSDDKFKVTLIIPKSAPIDALKKAIIDAAKQAWPKWNGNLKDLQLPFRDGDLKEREEYADSIYITCKTKKRPIIVDRNKQRIEGEEVYAGCYARLVVAACTYTQAGKQGVTFLLDTVQKVKDGEPLGGSGGGGLAALDDLEDDEDSGGSADDLY